MDIAACFAAHPVLAALPARLSQRLGAASALVELAAGETSNALGEGGCVMVVRAGHVRASAFAEGRLAFDDYEAGADFALDLVVAGEAAPVRALLALADTSLLVIPAAALTSALQSSTAALLAAARLFAQRLLARQAGAGPLQLVFRDLLRAARPVDDARWTLDPMPRHRELAARTGVTEDAAAAAVAHLVRLGVARRRYPALDIEDCEALRRLAD